MANRFGDLIRGARAGRGLRQVDVVRRLGYGNLNKGIRNLAALEEHGQGQQDFLEKVIRVLDLDKAALKTAYEEDEREESEAYEWWLDEPVLPSLSIFVCSIYCGCSLPEEYRHRLIPGTVSEHPALEALAIEEAKKSRQRVLLALNRRWHFTVDGRFSDAPRGGWWKASAKDRGRPSYGTFLKNGQGFRLGV